MSDQSNPRETTGRAAANRLNCPSCGAGFAIPQDLDKFKGKRSRCQVCTTPFRFAADGLSLTVIDEAPRAATVPPSSEERAPLAGLVAPRPGGWPKIDLDANQPIRSEPAPKRPVVPWAIAAVAIAAVVPALWLALGPSKKSQGTIQLQLEAPVTDLTLTIDDKPISSEQLKAPLTLPVGPHRLAASGRGLVAYQGLLPVFEGANPPFAVKLTAAPKSVEVAVAPPEGAAAPKGEPPPKNPAETEVAAVTEPASATAEVANEMPGEKVEADPAVVGTMPGEKVEADPAVVGAMPGEKVEADPAVVGAMPGEKVEADPGILGPEPKAGPKSNVTLKQVAADPETYLDAAVIPSDLLLIDTGAIRGPNGRRAGSLDHPLVIKSRDGAYRDSVKPGTSFEIRLTDESATAIRDQIRSGNLVGGEYPAIIKFKLTRDPANSQGFVGLVEWVELLVYVDPRPIFNGKSNYSKVFTVVRVADDGAQVGLSRSYQGWQKRLVPTGLLNKLRNAYRQAYTLNFGVEYDQLAQLLRTKLPANSRMFHNKLIEQLRGH